MSKLINGIVATASAVLTLTGVNFAHNDENTDTNNNYCVVQQNICPRIRDCVEWAITIANDPSHGYDQNDRWGPDNYDCSSLIISALRDIGGIDTGGATYTGNMCSELSDHGFSVYDFDYSQLQYGDIVLWHDYSTGNGHVELYIGDDQLVGAHINENGETTGGESGDQTGNEISVGEYYNGGWEYTIRYIPKALDYLQIPNYDDDFYAFIESDNTVLASDNDILYMEKETGNPKEVFHFVKEEKNRFTISNESYSGCYSLFNDDTGAVVLHEVGSESSCLTSVLGTVINTEYDSCSDEQRFRIRPINSIYVTYDYGDKAKECPIQEEHYNKAYSFAFEPPISESDGIRISGWYTSPDGGEKIEPESVKIPYSHTIYAMYEPVPAETSSEHGKGGGKHDGVGREDEQPTAKSKTEVVAIVDDIDVQHDDIYHPVRVTEPPVREVTPATEPVTERMPVLSDNTNQNEFNTSYSGSSNEIGMPQHNETSASINWVPGYNIGWKLEGDVFTITGSGEMPYYFNPSDAPWISVGPNVRKVVIEEGVTTVGGQAFTYFKNMKEVTLPSTIKVIGRYAFQTTPIQSISLPSGLERIEQGAFAACKNLTSITIPNSVYDLETFTFSECNSLSSVSLSTSLTSIGDGTFERCMSLRTLVIPSGVNCIGAYAFWACNMDAIYIPKSLKTVGYGGFFDSEIRNIYYGGSENEWKNIDVHNTRNGSLKNATIYYDSNC